MSVEEKLYKKNGMQYSSKIWINIPNKCPICHIGIVPKMIDYYYVESTDTFFAFYFCPSCNKIFIAEYNEIEYNDRKDNPADFTIYPQKYIKQKFDDIIEEKFERFCKTFNQSLQAETLGLDEIAGMGLRKSVEYLVKDYCILKNIDEEDLIKKMTLAQVIDKYIEDKRIKQNAKVSTWLANDETHYVKMYNDKDINDIKKFIKATVAYITYDLTTDEAIEIIEDKESTKN